MLDLSTAVLCDFAQVRDRLLFVSSGAVSRLYRQELPSPLGLMVGLVIEVPLEDAGMEHRLRAEVINRHGTVLATLENLFRVGDVGLFPHEVQQVPLVLSITGVRARTWGTHQVRLYLDDDLVRALTLYVVPAAGPQAVVRTTPTQSRVADDEGSLGGTGTNGVEEAGSDASQAATASEQAGEAGADDEREAHEIVIDLDAGDDDTVAVEVADLPSEPNTTSGTTSDEHGADTPDGDAGDLGAVHDPAHGGSTGDGGAEAAAQESPAPTPEPIAWDSPAPDPAPVPAAAEPTVDAAPPLPTATIDAPLAQDPAPPQWRMPPHAPPPPPPERDEDPATQVFDFDEDDLDAHREGPDATEDDPGEPEAATPPSGAEQEKSRFSFRYRYEEDEDSST